MTRQGSFKNNSPYISYSKYCIPYISLIKYKLMGHQGSNERVRFSHFTEYQLFYQIYKARITSLENNSMLTREGFVSSRGA